jgi:hypothetical protein
MRDTLVPKEGKILVEMTTQPPQVIDSGTLEERISHIARQAGLKVAKLVTLENVGRYRCTLSLLQ